MRKRVRVVIEANNEDDFLKLAEGKEIVKIYYVGSPLENYFVSAKVRIKDIPKAIKMGLMSKAEEAYGFLIAYDEKSIIYLRLTNKRLDAYGFPEILRFEYRL